MIRFLPTACRTLIVCVVAFMAGGCEVPRAVQPMDALAPTGPARATTAAVMGPNLIANPGFEQTTNNAPTAWSRMYWSTPVPMFVYPVAGRASPRAAQLSFSRGSTGDARWQHASVPVTPGVSYTYSEWYRASTGTQLNYVYTHLDGSLSYGWLATVPSSTSWRQLTTTFVIPAGVTRVSVYHLIRNVGTLTIDDVSLSTPLNVPTVGLVASPGAIGVGQQSTLTWQSFDATACVASGAWSGPRPLSGTLVVSPTATSTYTLTCTGTGGSAESSATITVTPTPPASVFPEGMVSLTFDDAWLTQYTNGLPILQAAGLKATFYLCSTPLADSWVRFMTAAQAVDIANRGHEIGGHTETHPDLITLTPGEVSTQLRASKSYLENLTRQQVVSFAYPFGSFNLPIQSAVSAAGYSSGRTVEFDVQNTPLTEKTALRSMTFLQTQSIAEIKAQIDQARANRTWFILAIHEIAPEGDIYTNSAARLQEVVDHIRATGIKVVTVKEGRALMR
jgi:peptidoglycan/xylan/chitin deacetylase (PgdA/CDA1 family)